MSATNGELIRYAIEAFRSTYAEGEDTTVWDGIDDYSQVIAILAVRVGPDQKGNSQETLDFEIDITERRREKLLHQAFNSVMSAEQMIINAYDVATHNDIPDDWTAGLGTEALNEVRETLQVEPESDLPDSWSAHIEVNEYIARYTRETERSTYEIFFPLNIVTRSRSQLPTTLSVKDYYIGQISFDDWEQVFSEVETDPEIEDMSDQYSYPGEFFSDGAEPKRTVNSFWSFETEASGVVAADGIFCEAIGSVVGLLNFVEQSKYRHPIEFDRLDTPSEEDQRHVVRPPLYLILQDGECVAFGVNEVPDGKSPLRIDTQNQNTIQELLSVTSRGRYDNPVEKYVESFSAFQKATTSTDVEKVFLALWQSIESVTMCEEGHSSAKILDRCRALVLRESVRGESSLSRSRTLKHTLFEERIWSIKNRRNNLVHGGAKVEITAKDLAVLRYTYDIVVRGMNEFLDDGLSKQEIIGVMEHGYRDIDDIDNKIQKAEDGRSDCEEQLLRLNQGKEWRQQI